MRLNQKKNHIIYGLNNCLSFLYAKNDFIINSIDININSPAHKSNQITQYINKNKKIVRLLNNKDFCNKYMYKHSQGIVINFTGIIEKKG